MSSVYTWGVCTEGCNLCWVTRVAMQAGANVDAQCDSGLTALHVACRGQAALVATLLLAANCDAGLQDSRGCTPVHYAAQTANWGLFNLLHTHPGCRAEALDIEGSLRGLLAR